MKARLKTALLWTLRSVRRSDWPAWWWYAAARVAGSMRLRHGAPSKPVAGPAGPGISVVIPSRNGRRLLEAQLPGVARELRGFPAEVIVVDNGSDDGTAEWLRETWPETVMVGSASPLSFARAVNLGLSRARYAHVCLLNNDMLLEPGFFAALLRAFDAVPDLFCATAQIRFPEGVRREETGKAVMAPYSQETAADFPIRCDDPLPGEDGTWVLYGSGGCSLYDAARLSALGGVDEAFSPAYVEDLDLGYRAWQREWPTVYVAGAVVEHRHRATTSRYFGEEELERILEVNYLKFLARAVADARLFRRLWARATARLLLRAARPAARAALRVAGGLALEPAQGPDLPRPGWEESFLALTDGSVAVFPGRRPSGAPRVVVTAPTQGLPKRAGGLDPVLVTPVEKLAPPPPELLKNYVEVVQVCGTEESAAFRAALAQSARKWLAPPVRA